MTRVSVYWRDSRIGSIAPLDGIPDAYCVKIRDDATIMDIAKLPIRFDPVFAELRGITTGDTE